MIPNHTKSLVGLCLLLFLGCVPAKEDNTTSKENLCRYSEYLQITPLNSGFRVQLRNPDNSGQIQSFVIDRAYSRIALLSATHVGMMAALQQQTKICAVSDYKYVYDKQLKELMRQAKIKDLRVEMGFSAQKILQSRAEVVVYSGFGNESQQLQRLPNNKIVQIPNYEWRENTPLARAEWVLLFGVLCGKFEEAQLVFKSVEDNYLKVKKEIEKNQTCNQNKVLISGNLYGDQWVAPAGESFEAQLYKDAGLAYLFNNEKGTGSIFKSLPEILQKSQTVNLWLNPGVSSRKKILQQYPKAKYFPFYKDSIYCYTANTNKYWELAAVHPDWLLSDLHSIAIGKPKKLHFYALLK